MDKKGVFDFSGSYVELAFAAAIIVGFLLRIFMTSLAVKISITVLVAFMVGRAMYKKKKGVLVAVVAIVAFLFGFLAGYDAFEKLLLLVVFFASYKLSRWAQEAGYIR
ncbi:hypothetical protein HN419_00790 [Candidatus Woesearchaeota archaeon]|jgi:hypothetical protein|nr:hypothetical protein [Candidatus Woesearchaeota archaeon]MBT3537466.1 hypothetical protein [Candidatus Woesearchaeota archaeon]MBT4696937.1 hypothetical protein [Candidatus Woesearchaeota archaeon]MBT4717341.1 hypothetical protein [Candidatus Woesearchaeota archaeon]MBT7106224.1 hypothetical protein [Candidatus Woesearchaeota archaeon]